ncbi:AraC family transcriptional regulator [Paenibacillus sp. S-38]|uniref:AraC family transcriptional regulator n=1 Tax=Paenibacillus sp. S-38 TaxID=3416710 RepID=UPI003CF12897
MDTRVETIPNYRIACVRQMGPYGPSNAQAMEKLKQWARDKKLLTESAILLGIPHDNPDSTLPEHCTYDAGIVIPPDYQTDDSILVYELTGGNYFICKIKHTAEDVQRAWTEIFSALHHNGYGMDHKPILERYTADMDFCEICVPIKR